MPNSPAIIITPTKPLSVNSHRATKYKYELSNEARGLARAQLNSNRLYSKLCYFHRGLSPIDADNLSKPVLDVLKGVVYEDDSQVVHRIVVKIELDVDTFELTPSSATLAYYEQLIRLIASEQHVLYIEIGELDSLHISLGVL